MSQQGAILQTLNMELVKYIEFVRDQEELIVMDIEKLEVEKREILDKIDLLNAELIKINHKLDEKYKKRRICEQAIDQSNTGIEKLIDSMKVLTTMIKQDAEKVWEHDEEKDVKKS